MPCSEHTGVDAERAQCTRDLYLLSSAPTLIFIFSFLWDTRKWLSRNLSTPFPFALKYSWDDYENIAQAVCVYLALLCFPFVLQLSCETHCTLSGRIFFFPSFAHPLLCTWICSSLFLMEIKSYKVLGLREKKELHVCSFLYVGGECWSCSAGVNLLVFPCNNSLEKTFCLIYTSIMCMDKMSSESA